MKRIIPIIILLAAVGGGYWWFSQSSAAALQPAAGKNALVGSGAIEAERVAITAELGGRVLELAVDEGDEVAAGDILVELDKSDLLARQVQLEAALSTARSNLELARAAARPEEVAVAQAQLQQAQVAQEGARLSWQEAQALANDPQELETRITEAQAQVTQAEENLEMARVAVKRLEIETEAASRDQSSHAALVQYEATQYRLQSARTGVKMAEVALEGAQQQLAHLINMRDRPLQLLAQANAAQAGYRQTEAAAQVAQANLEATKADPRPEDIAVAQAQVQEAEAALEAVKVKLAKQTLTAPRAGLITQKLVNPGELAAPGATLLELSDIETVDLIVYIPETQIGRVKIGQKAEVYVDAYEDEIFEGVVTFIPHEAEFTPRNVQTQEERVNLVFAVKITLDNPDHRLKPGMPADAEILPEAPANVDDLSTPTALPELIPTATPTPRPLPPTTTPTAQQRDAFAAPTSTPTPAAELQAEVIAWGLKVRRAPGINHPSFAHLTQGDVVDVLEVDPATGWLRVQLPNSQESGWITNSPTYVLVR